ncbi:MAG: Acetyl esterase Axe7A [Planctomycetaceae bacterium]|nr:Acetyl esterase Axe7A [Planctomycetaceae bacterium]
MNRIACGLVVMFALSLNATGVWADVALATVPEGKGFLVTTSAYQAKFDATGAMTSLIVSGEEFLAEDRKLNVGGTVKEVPAVFASHHRSWTPTFLLTGPVTIEDKTLKTKGEDWELAYTFEESAFAVAFGGFPKGASYALNAGYPNGNLNFWMSPKLHRAVDALAQGDLGWPIKGNPEPGNYSLIAKNGAGVEFQNTFWIAKYEDLRPDVQISKRGDFILLAEMAKQSKLITRRVEIHLKVDLGRSVELSITSPNPDHLFPESGPIVFPVEITAYYGQSLKGKLRFEGHNYVFKDKKVTAEVPISIESGAAPLKLAFAIQPSEPGHYIGNVIISDGEKDLYAKRVGFLYQPQKVPAVKPPEGFDEFWDKTLVELEKVPLDLTLTEQPDKETAAGKTYLAKFRAWEGRWAWAWLYEPKGDAKVDATVQCPAVSVYQPGQAQSANGELWIAAAVHGGDITTYPAKSDFDYLTSGITNRETTMLRYSYTCLVRCHDIIRQHRLCNGKVHVRGGSQGGGLSLVLAGLRPVTSVTGNTIALMRIDWTVLGLTTWGPRAPAGSDPKQVAEVIRYFDPPCFAHRVHAPIKFYLALFDFTGPVEGVLTAINALPAKTECRLVIDPFGGHFTANYGGRDAGKVPPVPRWLGTDAENKLNAK